jgi:hypothetical protein
MTTTAPGSQLSNEQLEELLALVKGSDSVELKLTVPESGHRSAAASLGMDALDAQIRQVFFFDTPELTLNNAGLVVRARRVQGKEGDTVVKLRPVVPDEVESRYRTSPSMKVEVDAMPGGFVCSASMKGKTTNEAVKAVAAGAGKLRPLFTKEQKAFYDANAPEGLKMSALTMLGPITLLKLRFAPEGFDRRMVAELWFYPDGSRILELSTTCPPADIFETVVQTRGVLERAGVDLTGEQQTKTKRALEFFTKQSDST